MKILSAEQLYLTDQATITNLPISSVDLMEKAATQCFDWVIQNYFDKDLTFHICCGIGNNGGDGLVLSRLLNQHGYTVHTYIICFSEKRSQDFQINLNRLEDLNVSVKEIRSGDSYPEFAEKDVVIDAIFGIGLKRPAEGFVADLIGHINNSEASVISIDLPSGLFSDRPNGSSNHIIKALYTLSFQTPKLAFLLPENHQFVGKWIILDIGLDQKYIDRLESKKIFVDFEQIQSIIRKRSTFSHKGTYGHSLIIGGSFGKIGAMVLAAKAALKSGSGLVTAYIPKCGYHTLQTAVPEAMVEVDDEKLIQFFNVKTKATAIGIGPGLGRNSKTRKGFVEFLLKCSTPLIIDADGLNMISEYDDLLGIIPKGSILTPHPKEFERLAGTWKDDYEKLEKQLKLSKTLDSVVVLKGAYTTIAHQGNLYFNSTGNPGLATAGSGDVLTGMITAFRAQGYDPVEASLLGVYLHGISADIAIEGKESVESMTAVDCISHLGEAFKEVHS
ncbi:NAD(P)H-hydrate dehydratase [Lutimonas zeaxanthinifaciens]|uniref:NAD(P)H-hydrate dehydratase n=1 Tax=Lutimonas zeaxanthinifaciens TaxID=3060215 RepID=UPI00265CE833|nr:NAD(P)H-hydrate dehydratase [Lutimonas sp. YSD2104]WKK67213.1 NAD(P)H-hydrate dehydratase [Lutimonas sp. YSD2104]